MARTVLIADDSPTIQNKAKGILTGEGLDVITVSNGVAAIKKLPQVMPLLILADVSMPGRDGYEVCDFVKNSPDLRHIPVVLIFSDVDPYNEEQGTRVHADGKIRKMAAGKPFNPEELISTVTGFLSQIEGSGPGTNSARPSGPVTEPVDEEPQIRPRKGLDLGTLPQGVAFAELPVTEFPPLQAEQAPPSHSPMEAETAVGATPLNDPANEAPVLSAQETPDGPEPVLIEEAPAETPPPPIPEAQRTMLFRAPSDIAEPVLSDELAPPPPEPPAVETRPAATLGSFLRTNAPTEARFASSESLDPEVDTVQSETTEEAVVTGGSEASLDPNLVSSIVKKVVAKMSPPALSQEVIDEMARKLAGEIIAEIIAESS